jgi:cell division protein FtsB
MAPSGGELNTSPTSSGGVWPVGGLPTVSLAGGGKPSGGPACSSENRGVRSGEAIPTYALAVKDFTAKIKSPETGTKLNWWGWLDSNQRPKDYESSALTAELHPRIKTCTLASNRDEYNRFATICLGMVDEIKNAKNKISSWAAYLKDLRVVGLLVFLVIALMVSWSSVKAIETNYGLQKQIAALRQENAVKQLANENLKLENEYYESSQHLELAARRDFGLAAPGETVLNVPRSVALSFTVDLPKAEEPESKPQTEEPAYQRNFQAWLDFLFHRKD